MAAERDALGPTGPGLSGAGRDNAGLEAGTTRSMAMGDAPGSAEVHSGIAFAPEAEPQGVRDRAAHRVKDVAGTVAERAGDLGQRARSAAETVGERAGHLASNARERVSGLSSRATTALEDRGVLGKMRENPLPALGLAFAVGFLLAGAGGSRGRPGGKATRVRGELRNALMAGVSAGLAQGARGFLRNLGAEDSVVNEVVQNIPGLGGPAGRGGGGSQGASGRGGYGGGTRPAAARTGGGTTTHRPPSHQENY